MLCEERKESGASEGQQSAVCLSYGFLPIIKSVFEVANSEVYCGHTVISSLHTQIAALGLLLRVRSDLKCQARVQTARRPSILAPKYCPCEEKYCLLDRNSGFK